MFLSVKFTNGAKPYVFFGTIDAVEEDIDLWKRFWDIKTVKTNQYGIFAVATEKEEARLTDAAEDFTKSKAYVHEKKHATDMMRLSFQALLGI